MIDHSELLGLLACPACGHSLQVITHCANCKADFPEVDGTPVLIPLQPVAGSRSTFPRVAPQPEYCFRAPSHIRQDVALSVRTGLITSTWPISTYSGDCLQDRRCWKLAVAEGK